MKNAMRLQCRLITTITMSATTLKNALDHHGLNALATRNRAVQIDGADAFCCRRRSSAGFTSLLLPQPLPDDANWARNFRLATATINSDMLAADP